jgi:hypothetical protein
MANELKLAKASREVARELNELAPEARYPFDVGHLFRGRNKAPCCVLGHVIERAGLTALVKGRPSFLDDHKIVYRNAGDAISDICGTPNLEEEVSLALCDVIEANDFRHDAEAVAAALYEFADLIEVAEAPSADEEA